MGAGIPSSGSSRMVLSEINVTPLVDVMLVLLVIFMVTAPMMQQGLDVQLPETANSGVPTTTDEALILSIRKNGSLHVGDTEMKMNTLKSKLQAIFATRKNKQIYVHADKAVDYGTVAAAMGEIRAAGIYQIGLITLPKAGAP